MKHYLRMCVLLVVVACLVAIVASAQEPPKAGFRAWAYRELSDVENKLVKLAEAMPQEKYTWRPGEGVRSVSEVYMHVAAGNFSISRFIGAQVPAGYDPRTFEKSATEKAKVVETLKQSFEHSRQAINKLSDADLDKPVKLFGRDATQRDVVLVLVTHAHEHLGQSIAYARMNNVVPPWTEEQQQRQQQQQKKESQ